MILEKKIWVSNLFFMGSICIFYGKYRYICLKSTLLRLYYRLHEGCRTSLTEYEMTHCNVTITDLNLFVVINVLL